MNIPLDRDKPTALPRQIQAHLERLIHERLLTAGMKLPATRELARQLGVNRGTVALAYEELVATGWARAHVGQGTFVAERPASGAAPIVSAAAAPIALDWSGLFSRSAQILGADDERSRAVTPIPSSGAVTSFAGGMPDSGLFPTDAFRRVLNQVIRDEGPALLQYYPAGGYPPLRAAIPWRGRHRCSARFPTARSRSCRRAAASGAPPGRSPDSSDAGTRR